MSAIVLCDLPGGSEIKSHILDRVVLLSVKGSGELLFVGRCENNHETVREIIAVRLRDIEGASALVQSWRSELSLPPGSYVTALQEAPMRASDNLILS